MSIPTLSFANHDIPAGLWDRAGIATSALCIAHCLVSPLLLGMIPVLAATESQIHSGLLTVLFVIGLWAFIPAQRRHRSRLPVLMAAFGFAMLSGLVPFQGYVPFETGESLSTMLGGALLIAAHATNIRCCRCCHGERSRPLSPPPG